MEEVQEAVTKTPTSKKRKVLKIAGKLVVILALLGVLGYGGYRLYKDEQHISTLNKDLYAVRDDYYAGQHFAMNSTYVEPVADATGTPGTTYTSYPTFTQVSQKVETMSALSPTETQKKQQSTGVYSSASNVYADTDVRVLELKIENTTGVLYTYYGYELRALDDEGVSIDSVVDIEGMAAPSTIYLEAGKSTTVKLYFKDTGNTIKRLVNTAYGQVYNL